MTIEHIRQGLELALVKAINARLRSLEARVVRDGEQGEQGEQGLAGEPGPEGPRGPIGPMPRHEWAGTELRFQLSPDQWGEWKDLKGPKGDKGDGGRTAIVGGGPIRLFSVSLPGLVPAPTVATGKFLRDDATWQTVSGGAPTFGYSPQGWQ